ncbi:CutA1 divalent ion tolerance protein-domain-containing protein [Gaertneriomyces semiglobifer]|nr:CutA1 divalent ion tolerance protein-domain-containing protein [Gaertneriomyces semiglobifer]
MASSAATRAVVLLSTAPSEVVAKQISRDLVERKLVACVNIVPKIQSVYWWDGKVQEDEEYLMVIKTQSTLVSEINQRLKEKHPYEVPELISLKVEDGNDQYLRWISDSTCHTHVD